MFTISYKGFYIHGYCDKPNCRVFGIIQGKRYEKECGSLLAGKQWITKTINRAYPKEEI